MTKGTLPSRFPTLRSSTACCHLHTVHSFFSKKSWSSVAVRCLPIHSRLRQILIYISFFFSFLPLRHSLTRSVVTVLKQKRLKRTQPVSRLEQLGMNGALKNPSEHALSLREPTIENLQTEREQQRRRPADRKQDPARIAYSGVAWNKSTRH